MFSKRMERDWALRLEKVTELSLLSLQIRLKDNRQDGTYVSHVSQTEEPRVAGEPRRLRGSSAQGQRWLRSDQ
jgi:hypothetical protein